jgi:hydroxymethylpyrimidine pyrophosphatase-like HAD family hydrolase
MRYLALACDYDGTLAQHGQVDARTREALGRLRKSGRRLLLVTGRELDDLRRVCPDLEPFDLIVAENGAVLYEPRTRESTTLAEPPPAELVAALEQRGVAPLSVGRVMIATWEPHQNTVLDGIHELGLERQVIFNKGAVMVLPSGVNKASGLTKALDRLQLSPHNVVGVGDAENDLGFLALCECGVAVANALEAVKKTAAWTTRADHGAGVIELVDALLADDLASLEPRLGRRIAVGRSPDGQKVEVPSYGPAILLAGTSGSGKSTFATSLIERFIEAQYQYCVVDPEGDYTALESTVVLGDPKRVPSLTEVQSVLAKPETNLVVNLLGVKLEDRPSWFATLWAALLEIRERLGRPHWILLDEAHHLLPVTRSETIRADLRSTVLITVHPEQLAAPVLRGVDLVLGIGREPASIIRAVAGAHGRKSPEVKAEPLATGRALAWIPHAGGEARELEVIPPRTERQRHLRKYAHGDLGPEGSFVFTGPEGRLRLRAQNLQLFLQIADGVDEATWEHHRRRGDYSRWFREVIKDNELAEEARQIELGNDLSPTDARARLREAVETRYTAPA